LEAWGEKGTGFVNRPEEHWGKRTSVLIGGRELQCLDSNVVIGGTYRPKKIIKKKRTKGAEVWLAKEIMWG